MSKAKTKRKVDRPKPRKWHAIVGDDYSVTWGMDVPTGCLVRVDHYAELEEGSDPLDDRPVISTALVLLEGVPLNDLYRDDI